MQINTAEEGSLLYIMNKLNLHGKRQVASGVGRNCCFWIAACFHSEVSFWNGRHVQYFFIKAQHYSKTLSREKQDSWRTPDLLRQRARERHEHTMFSKKHYFTALFPIGLPPPQFTSALLRKILVLLQNCPCLGTCFT